MKNRKTKIALRAVCGLLAFCLVWTAYVASKGYFYFSAGTPLCDGKIGAVSVGNRAVECFTVGTGKYAFDLGCENVITFTNTLPHRFVYAGRGEMLCQFDFKKRPLWLEWQNIGTSDSPIQNSGRHIELPCVWPLHFLGIRKFMTELAKPILITDAKVTQFGTYSAGANATIDTNGVVRGGKWPPTFIESTTNIPAVPGVMFGVRYELEGSFRNLPGRNVPVVKRWLHPPIPSTRTGELRTQDDEEGFAYRGTYSFKWLLEEKHVAPGKWTFQLIYDGTILCQQCFVLVGPGEAITSKIDPPAEGD